MDIPNEVPVFVRCERCRAVYLTGPDAAGAVVACARCPHVFEARGLTKFLHGGTFGGAAVPIETLRRWVPPPVAPTPIARVTRHVETPKRAPAPPKKAAPPPSKLPLYATAAVVVAVLGVFAVLAWRSRAKPVELSPAAQKQLAEAGKQLAQDDEASLEAAIAGFSALSAQQPEMPVFVAKRALATALLGASLKAEANDVSLELARLDRAVFQARADDLPDSATRVAALQQAQSDLRLRAGPAGERADKLLREALELARKAQESEVPEAFEAMAVAYGARAEEDRVRLAAGHLEADDAWVAEARASLKMQGIVTAAKAGEARAALGSAAGAHPELLRLQADLARATFYAKAFDEADSLFQAVARRNPAHEAAKRGLELVAAQRSPAP